MGNDKSLIPISCSNCGKKIGEVWMKEAIISIKCPKCNTINIIETKANESVKNAKS